MIDNKDLQKGFADYTKQAIKEHFALKVYGRCKPRYLSEEFVHQELSILSEVSC